MLERLARPGLLGLLVLLAPLALLVARAQHLLWLALLVPLVRTRLLQALLGLLAQTGQRVRLGQHRR
jgi:hypothetical protein